MKTGPIASASLTGTYVFITKIHRIKSNIERDSYCYDIAGYQDLSVLHEWIGTGRVSVYCCPRLIFLLEMLVYE